MARNDWYRRTTWTPADAEAFQTRLRRSRQRAQHLCIQARTLLDAGSAELAQSALTLIDQMLAEHPEPFFLSGAHLTRAECLLALGDIEEAIAAFRASLAAQRAMPNVCVNAYLPFAWTVGRLGLTEHFDEVLDAMEEFRDPADLAFPANAYLYFGALSFIADRLDDRAGAALWAHRALRSASTSVGPFPRHPGLGLVEQPDSDIQARLWKIASGNAAPAG